MTGAGARYLMAGAVLALLAGCGGGGEPRLMNLASTSRGPDEFAILPTRPLEQPESYAVLPTPTPGGRNLADPTPRADAIAALGGNPAVLNRPSADGGLLAYATRYGTAPGIRSVLATEDRTLRSNSRGRLMERLFNVNVYFRAYRDQELDQHRELERFRRAGIRTPAAPPERGDPDE